MSELGRDADRATSSAGGDDPRALAGELERLRRSYDAAVEECERLRFELYEWRERAIEAESVKAEFDSWRSRRGWRAYMALLGLRTLLAPAGSRRNRVVTGLLRRVVREKPEARVARREVRKGLLFISGLSGDTMRYRCDHQGEAFALSGGTFDVAFYRDVDFERVLDEYECFVLHRVLWSTEIERFIDSARERGKPVTFDTDDLVFDPDAARFIALLQHEYMNETRRLRFVDGLHRSRRAIEASDAVIVSTDFLAERVRHIHPRVAIGYNLVSAEMAEQAGVLRRRAKPRDQHTGVRIGYLSGSPTHDRDFREAAEAVLWALAKFAGARFVTVGFVTLDERFEKFADRIERIPMQRWKRLPEILASIDINLAPLEPENPFTESKSCVKYIEAGLLGVPTIASPRSDFARAIAHGVNGLLAEGPEAWRDSLGQLVESPELRRALGDAACDDVRRNHTTSARSRALYATLAELVGETDDESLSINWVSANGNASGEIADYLGRHGHRVGIYAEADVMPAGDVTIGTGWGTASTIAAHEQSLFRCLYVESLEPRLSEEALSAYAFPLRHVCRGPELSERLSRITGRPADSVDDERGLDDYLRRVCFLRLSQERSGESARREREESTR